MGLCKCPKKRVTNQFCFDHRVNVCEHCMVTNHPKCIVQSYLQWLQDSDYNPNCELCSQPLAEGNCVRLVCYHIYHWACLDQYARSLPATTAPAGYCCPSCKSCLFPASNLVSPVGDALREILAGVNWAQVGLNLPLLSEDRDQQPFKRSGITELMQVENDQFGNMQPKRPIAAPDISSSQQMVVHVESIVDSQSFIRAENSLPSLAAKKAFLATETQCLVDDDHDENKYKKRSAIQWCLRWWKSTTRPRNTRRSAGGLFSRNMMLAILCVIGVVTVIVIFSWLGQMATENDPNLDMNQNPMLHIKRY